MAAEVADGDIDSLQCLHRLKDHSGKVQQLYRVERKLEELWKGLQRNNALVKDCDKEVAELREEKESCLQRLSTIEQDIQGLEEARSELSTESEVYRDQLEVLKRVQYTPLLTEVNKHQGDFGLEEVQEVACVKGIPTASYTEAKQKSIRVSRKMVANGDTLRAGGSSKESSTGRRSNPGSVTSPRQVRALHCLHQSEKAGPSHKTCVHCSGSIARNAVMCKWCFELVPRSNNRHT